MELSSDRGAIYGHGSSVILRQDEVDGGLADVVVGGVEVDGVCTRGWQLERIDVAGAVDDAATHEAVTIGRIDADDATLIG